MDLFRLTHGRPSSLWQLPSEWNGSLWYTLVQWWCALIDFQTWFWVTTFGEFLVRHSVACLVLSCLVDDCCWCVQVVPSQGLATQASLFVHVEVLKPYNLLGLHIGVMLKDWVRCSFSFLHLVDKRYSVILLVAPSFLWACVTWPLFFMWEGGAWARWQLEGWLVGCLGEWVISWYVEVGREWMMNGRFLLGVQSQHPERLLLWPRADSLPV